MELEEKLKLVAEYDGYFESTYQSFTPPNTRNCLRKKIDSNWDNDIIIKMPIHESDFKYHTSFDWSIPVWAKANKEMYKIIEPFSENAGNFVALEQRAEIAIREDNKQAFFDNLVELILQIEETKK